MRFELLEGENRQTEDGVTARHWHDIYARLISFTDRRMSSGTDTARRKGVWV